MSERLKNAGVTHQDYGGLVKSTFVSLVEGHYLQRIPLPTPNVTLISHGDQKMGGVVTMPVSSRFELPPELDGE